VTPRRGTRDKGQGARVCEGRRWIAALVGGLSWLAAVSVSAQSVSQKGFVELRGTSYADSTANDSTRSTGELLLRQEVAFKPASWLTLAGSVDLRADSRDWSSSDWTPDWQDRGLQRPRVGISRLAATVSRGPVTLDLGKQYVRWGKADVVNPTDRFAPRDFLNVLDTEFLAVTGARAVLGLQSDSIDLVYVPVFTPSRTPLPNQRWAPQLPFDPGRLPPGSQVIDAGRFLAEGGQYGARWNHVGSGFEFSASGYRGFLHTPVIESLATIAIYPPVVAFAQVYPRIWMVGGDAAVPMRAFTLKGEAAFFGSDDNRTDEYWLYVLQLERQAGEWFFVVGYAGEVVTDARQQLAFAPERGLAKAFLGRAGYTIDTNRSLALEGAVRQDGDGSWLRGEYSHAVGQHVRVALEGNWIRGSDGDFFGRYRRNSNLTASLRYSY